MRSQARDWLTADLHVYAKQLKEGKVMQVVQAIDRLQDWQKDAGLADVRTPAAVQKLPAAERAAWRKFWADVQSLLHEANGRFLTIEWKRC